MKEAPTPRPPELQTVVTEELKQVLRIQGALALKNLKRILKRGDKVSVTKCPGNKRVITFDHWDGNYLASSSGIKDYTPSSVYSINDHEVNPLYLNKHP